MPLDAVAEIKKIRDQYNKDPKQDSSNILLLSESGSGKTFFSRTCRFPMHIDSFDPGGTKGIREFIDKGLIVVDASFESEDPMKPKQFEAWKKKFKARKDSGYFDHFATYMLDSATTWSESILSWVMGKDGVAGQAPRFTKDYTPQKIEIRNHIRNMLNLPCDFILTGHLKLVEDAESGTHKFRFLTTGQGAVTIPLLFDEIYVLTTKSIGAKTKYELLTKSSSKHMARSRLAADGLLDAKETPDFKHLLKKAGKPFADKKLLDK